MLRARARLVTLLALSAISASALLACGESSQEKAKAQVCSARADLSKQIATLEGLKLSTNLPTEIKNSFEAISADLKKIKDAQPNLDSTRKAQVESATSTFETQLATIVSSVTSQLGSTNPVTAITSAEPALKSAVKELAADFKTALGPISCS